MTAISSDCLWRVDHLTHFAWYQRAFLIGDFTPGFAPKSEYVIDAAGKVASDPHAAAKCVTCGKVPKVEDLEVFEVATGHSGFLTPFRSGARPWPPPTDPSTCWFCNSKSMPVVQYALCQSCLTYLSGVR